MDYNPPEFINDDDDFDDEDFYEDFYSGLYGEAFRDDEILEEYNMFLDDAIRDRMDAAPYSTAWFVNEFVGRVSIVNNGPVEHPQMICVETWPSFILN